MTELEQGFLDMLAKRPRAEPRLFTCHVCRDSGWVDIPKDDEYETPGVERASIPGLGPRKVQSAGNAVRRCNGPRDLGCPYEKARRQEAINAAAAKPGRGEDAGL